MDQSLQQQTNSAFGIPPTDGAPEGMPGLAEQDAYDDSIKQGLETHLNHVSTQQKSYLLENLTPEVVTILGIVNGKEVYDYFSDIFNQINSQQNSTQQAGQNTGSQPVQPQQMAQSQPEQATATPAPPMA